MSMLPLESAVHSGTVSVGSRILDLLVPIDLHGAISHTQTVMSSAGMFCADLCGVINFLSIIVIFEIITYAATGFRMNLACKGEGDGMVVVALMELKKTVGGTDGRGDRDSKRRASRWRMAVEEEENAFGSGGGGGFAARD
ncbi:hypothetical protein ACH5RR_025257 [Cinchona calisaya]|uniref:Uncharacterized protein n=1 Tax=Cinchona calisaya TaxID=153742 RepID=A0ABD2YZ43_9GENT